jgi:hypothetical protein
MRISCEAHPTSTCSALLARTACTCRWVFDDVLYLCCMPLMCVMHDVSALHVDCVCSMSQHLDAAP